MRILRKIMVFDKGGDFLSMLKGYCYANNIQMAEVEFSIEGINEVQNFNPALIFVPFDLISHLANNTESGLLKLICKKKEIKICALKNGLSRKDSEEVSEWIDMIIDNPIDIVEIDRVLKTVFPWNDYLPERRTNKDRRIISDRRQCPMNETAYMASRGIEAQYSNRRPHADGVYEVQDFNIDSRNKCLVLHGRRIYLTPKEFDLIEYLSTDFNRIFSPDKIISHLWQENHKATKSDLYQHIHLLRKKIEKDHSQPQLILNVKGFGYKLNIFDSHDPCVSCVHYEKLQGV